jgi:hypothetical protein
MLGAIAFSTTKADERETEKRILLDETDLGNGAVRRAPKEGNQVQKPETTPLH